MTADEARDLFSDALEGELSADKKAELDTLLESDAALRGEYDAFRAMLAATRGLAIADEEAAPDLVTSVQDRIRRKSRGRFYRDRFATQRGASAMMPMLLGIVILITLGVATMVLHYVEEQPASYAPPRD